MPEFMMSGLPPALSVTYAMLAASARPKQGAVATTDFTTTSASAVNITGMTVTTNGPSLILIGAQIITAAAVTQGLILTDVTTISGVWFTTVQTTPVADLTSFGMQFSTNTNATGSPNTATAGTYDVMFIGWSTASGAINVQALSDGTRTLTVKVGSQIASNV